MKTDMKADIEPDMKVDMEPDMKADMKSKVSTSVRIVSIILAVLMLACSVFVLGACSGKNSDGKGKESSSGSEEAADLRNKLDETCAYLEKAHDGAYKAGESSSDWTIVVYSKDGKDFDYGGYLEDMEKYVTEKYKSKDKLDRDKATEWHHAALAVLACGGDPTKIGKDKDGKPVDLIADGTYNWSQTESLGQQGSNALIYALITLDAGDFDVPEGSKYTRESIIDDLLKCQYTDGSFALGEGEQGNTDITAMAVQALAPYYTKIQRVQESVDQAVAYLSREQQDSGLYINGDDYSSETVSQVILALCALGRDPAEDEQFKKAGGSILECLMMFRMDDGSFSHTVPEDTSQNGGDLMASQQAGLAIAETIRVESNDKE